MAVVLAVKTDTWDDPTTWSTGQVPGPLDVVYANGFNISLTVPLVEVAQLRTDAGDGASDGGRFRVNSGDVEVIADLYCGSTINFEQNSNGTVVFRGDVHGSTGTGWNHGAFTISGDKHLEIHGNVSITSGVGIAVAGGSLLMYGNVIAGDEVGIYIHNTTSACEVYGDITAGNANGAHGVSIGNGGTCSVHGTVTAGSTQGAHGIYADNGASVYARTLQATETDGSWALLNDNPDSVIAISDELIFGWLGNAPVNGRVLFRPDPTPKVSVRTQAGAYMQAVVDAEGGIDQIRTALQADIDAIPANVRAELSTELARIDAPISGAGGGGAAIDASEVAAAVWAHAARTLTADPAGTQTLLGRLTDARAALLDNLINLDAAISSIEADGGGATAEEVADAVRSELTPELTLIDRLNVEPPESPVIAVPGAPSWTAYCRVYGTIVTAAGAAANGVDVQIALYAPTGARGDAIIQVSQINLQTDTEGRISLDGNPWADFKRNDAIEPSGTRYRLNIPSANIRNVEFQLTADTFDLASLIG